MNKIPKKKNRQNPIVLTIKKFFPKTGLRHIKLSAAGKMIPVILFFSGLIIYLITRIYRITDYPIYFFTDEAHIALFGEYLAKHKFIGPDSIFAQMYFEQAPGRWMPLLPVYFQAFALPIFGKSVTVTRTVSALTTLAIPLATALILKIAFRSPIWWVGSLLPAFIPTLFLHSRTAFETVTAVSFYSLFVLSYCLYRLKNANYIFLSVLFAAASFYSYSNSQAVTILTVFFFLLSDITYHLKKRRQTILAIVLGLFVSLPFFQYQIKHREGLSEHLCKINSYWCGNGTPESKLATYVKTYAKAFHPAYWFLPDQPDIDRHRMSGYARFSPYLFPFLILGILFCLIKIRRSENRILLFALIAGPAGSAMAEIGITRILTMVFPMLVLSGIGLTFCYKFAAHYLPKYFFIIFSTMLGSYLSFLLLSDALTDGPTWYRDYGLYGMQYGAQQLFGDAIPEYQHKHPFNKIYISPVWANEPERFVQFFLPENLQQQIIFKGGDDFLKGKIPFEPDDLIIITAKEYERLKNNPVFNEVNIEKTIPYPDQTNGFYLVRLKYAPGHEEIYQRMLLEEQKPISSKVNIKDHTVTVRFSRLASGEIVNIFDSNPKTLVRGLSANPFLIEIFYESPQKIHGISLTTGSMNFSVKTEIASMTGSDKSYLQTDTFSNRGPDPTVVIPISEIGLMAKTVKIEITDLGNTDSAEIHIRDLNFN